MGSPKYLQAVWKYIAAWKGGLKSGYIHTCIYLCITCTTPVRNSNDLTLVLLSSFIYLFLKFCTCLPHLKICQHRIVIFGSFGWIQILTPFSFFFKNVRHRQVCFFCAHQACVSSQHWVSTTNADWKTSRYTPYIRVYPPLHHCLCLCDLYIIERIKTTLELWRSEWVISHSPPVGEHSVTCNIYPSTFIWKIFCLPVTLRLRIKTCLPKSDSQDWGRAFGLTPYGWVVICRWMSTDIVQVVTDGLGFFPSSWVLVIRCWVTVKLQSHNSRQSQRQKAEH